MKFSCLYCGKLTKRGSKGEHIIPEVVGGALTLNDVSDRAVCQRCNSGVLSQLDKELGSRSDLSIIASREIGAHLWQVWDVDHGADNLLLDAKPAWAADEWLSGLICYPQVIFERTGLAVHGDYEEFRRFGQEDAIKVLFQAVRHCYQRYCAGERWRWAEIVAPLRSKEWSIETGSVLRPLNLNVEWNNSAVVIPSVQFQKALSSISVELLKKKPRVT